MKTILAIITISILFISCDKDTVKIVEDEKTGKPMLLGETDRSDFEQPEFSEWYNTEYDPYEPDEFVIEQLKEFIDSTNIEVFMGTWCGDSRREVPRFLKVLDLAGYDEDNLVIVNVDREKKSPSRAEKDKNIEFVPTFIVYKNDDELGRIIEYPMLTIEGDLLTILIGLE